jgi:tetratricopeptide (TPR) repeat protein
LALDKEKILDYAQKLVMKGQPKKAIAEYIKLIEADPKDKRLYLKLGDLYFKNGEHEKAITEYMKLAGLYAEEDLNSRAISVYKKVLTINPKHIDALYKIAGLYLKEGLPGDAKNYYTSILELNPDDQEVHRVLKGFDTPSSSRDILRYVSGDIPKKMPAVEFPPSPFPTSPDEIKPFDDKSDLFPSSVVEPQRLPEAAEVRPPDKDSEMHYHLGIAYKEMELYDYAISEFELAASNPAIKFDCYIMLGGCFLEKGDNSQAIQYFKEASQIQGLTKDKLARLHFNLGLAYEASGMFSQAIETFHQALRLDQSFSEAQERLQRLQQLQK